MKRKGRLLFVLGVLFLLQAGGVAWSQVTERVSVDSAGNEANGASNFPSISSDGRYVAFESFATNLVEPVTNGNVHIFVRDLVDKTTTLVSVSSTDVQGNNDSYSPSISGDGRYVAFESQADNLIVGDNNPFPFSDLLLRDRQMKTTTLVSVDWKGVQGDGPSSSPSISADGRYVAFQSEANLVDGDISLNDIFVRDLVDKTTTLVSVSSTDVQGNNDSYSPSISGDGRYVAFESLSTNLVAPVTNGNVHIFVRDLVDKTTTLVSVSSTDVQGNNDSSSPSISGDGRYVAFESLSTNLVAPVTNGNVHIFVRDLVAKTTTLVSVSSTDVQGNDDSSSPSISSDGRYVAFESLSTNLVAPATNGNVHIFVRDLWAGTTTLVSVNLTGVEGNGNSNAPSMSADGTSVTFQSDADNLVAGDTPFLLGGFPDIFVDDLQAGAGGDGSDGDGNSGGGCFIATAANRAVW